MAMTKKEQAAYDAMAKSVAIAKALRWTPVVGLDVPPPKPGDTFNKVVKGWSFNEYNLEANPSCSSCIYHSIRNDEKTDSQNPISQYSTRLRALQAMRNSMELKFAKELAEVDEMIAKAEAGE
jgi:hypothetical protein